MSGRTRTREREPEEIEMTTFKVWGRRLPGGDEEVDRDEADEEADLFARFPDDFNTYRDAASTKVSAADLKKLGEVTTRMIERARAMKKEMEDAGKPVDLDLIVEKTFGHIPRGLVPPEFIKELQSWRRVRDAMNARAVVKGAAPEGQAAKIKGGLDKAGVAVTLTKLGLKAMPGGESIDKVVEHINEALEYLGKAMEGAGKVIDAKQAKDDLDKPALSPVEIKMADEKLMKALQGLGGLGADAVAKFVPIISTLKNGADCFAAIKDTMERTKLRAGTGELRDQATLDTTNQLSRAFDQAQGRETRLAVGSGINAATSGLSTAASVATATGIGAKVGLALEVTSTAISVGGKVVLTGFDEVTARKALKTLRDAQAGDTEAQQKVFADNAHYAKMLIAVMAIDGNKLARTYLIDRGLEEGDLDNPLTTADILFDYAVMKSDETAAPSSKIDQALELLRAAKEKAESFIALCESGLQKIGLLKKEPEKVLEVSAPLPTVAGIREMWKQVEAVKQTKSELMAQGKSDDRIDERMMELLNRLADAEVKFLEGARTLTEEADRADKELAEIRGKGSKEQIRVVTERLAVLRDEQAKWTALREAVAAHGA